MLRMERVGIAVDVSEEDAVAKVRGISGRGLHHSFEAIRLGATQAQAIEMSRVGGGAEDVHGRGWRRCRCG